MFGGADLGVRRILNVPEFEKDRHLVPGVVVRHRVVIHWCYRFDRISDMYHTAHRMYLHIIQGSPI